ncbi:MAG: transcription antitermination factor NusB [Candidatus Xenobia bacterium]
MSSKRRAARVLVLLGLYQLDVGHQPMRDVLANVFSRAANESLAEFLENRKAKLQMKVQEVQEDPDLRAFVENGVQGTWEHRDAIDRVIAERAQHWRLERMARIDVNILRMAIHEMQYRTDVPKAVSVNEAVELAKAFGDDDSGRFVNGILGSLTSDEADEAVKQERPPGRGSRGQTT